MGGETAQSELLGMNDVAESLHSAAEYIDALSASVSMALEDAYRPGMDATAHEALRLSNTLLLLARDQAAVIVGLAGQVQRGGDHGAGRAVLHG